VQGLIKLLREVTADAKSVAVGFGVSGPDQVWPFPTSALPGVLSFPLLEPSKACNAASHNSEALP
jgi:hypothetical protein